MHTLFLKIKKNFLTISICFFLFLLLLFSKTNLTASKNGLILWANCIVPTLFPFLVAIELLNNTNFPTFFGKIFFKYMKPLFNIPGEGAYAFIMGIICGYPTGAKIINNFYSNNICTKNEAERMLAFTNNSGPLFIIGTVGITFFNNTEIGFLLLFTHLLSAITVGIIFGIISRFFLNNSTYTNIKSNPITYKTLNKNWGELLSSSIISSVYTLFIIGGFIIIFSIIISILNQINFLNLITFYSNYSKAFFSGIIELTTGCSLIASIINKKISYNIIICAFLLGFGGLSVLLQVFSIAAKNKLSIKWYFYGKLLQGIFASIYTIILLNNFNFLNFDL